MMHLGTPCRVCWSHKAWWHMQTPNCMFYWKTKRNSDIEHFNILVSKKVIIYQKFFEFLVLTSNVFTISKLSVIREIIVSLNVWKWTRIIGPRLHIKTRQWNVCEDVNQRNRNLPIPNKRNKQDTDLILFYADDTKLYINLWLRWKKPSNLTSCKNIKKKKSKRFLRLDWKLKQFSLFV